MAGVRHFFFAETFQTAWSIPRVTTRGPWKGFVEWMADIVNTPADDNVIVDGNNASNNCHAPT